MPESIMTEDQMILFGSEIIIGDICRELWCLMGFPGGSDGKESTCNAGDLHSIPGWEDPLEDGMTIHTSVLDWRIPMDREEPGGLQSMGSKRVGHD